MLEGFGADHITDFGGLYARGSKDAVPSTHFVTAENLRYFNEGFATRFGTSRSLITPNPVRRFFPYHIEGQVNRIIYLDFMGAIYDSLFPATPILTIPELADLSMAVFNDRAYLSPHNGVTGLAGQFVYIYQGDGNPARIAAGNPPSGFTLTVEDSTVSGVMAPGSRLFAVAFETTSGFITQPGPEPYRKHTTAGGLKTEVRNLPIGPAGTIARHVLASKTVPVPYDDNYDWHELFFVPGGKVSDNTTVLVTVDFYDADLVASAEYLKDEMRTIPAVLGLSAYQGSLVGWAPNTEPSSVYVSKAGEPESISLIEGGIEVDAKAGGGVRNCVDFRGTLMIHKAQKSYITQNNGSEPSTWRVNKIDQGLGTEVFGIAAVLDEEGNSTDRYGIATRKGLILYDGTFENNITWKIDDLWKRINRAAFNKVQVTIDSINECIYLIAPLDSSVYPNVLLYGDYSKGLDPKNIRWSTWTFPYFPMCIGIDIDAENRPVLKIGSSIGITNLDYQATEDAGVMIPTPTFQTAYLGSEDVSVNQFGGIRLRAYGIGPLILQFLGLDNQVEVTPPVLTLSSTPGRFLQRDFCLTSQRGSLKCWTTQPNQQFWVTKISVYHVPMWVEEPA